MKIQDLAIIFVIIILPISLVISAYTQYQIKTVSTQTLYDTKLTSATYDAIKAFQINAQNSSTSNLANSRIRDLEASVSTFKNSLMATFRLNGYSEDDLNQYIPALVYTLYDGFYIYSPFNNLNYQYETQINDGTGEEEYKLDEEGNKIPTQDNGKDIHGLKPYINYSCRYKKGNVDVVITYALDNHISIQGKIGDDYVNNSGYLVDGITIDEGTGEVKYKEITIEKEELKEYLPLLKADSPEINLLTAYSYVKINGVKYYRVDLIEGVGDEEGYDSIIYISNGTINTQCKLTKPKPGEGLTGYQEKQNDEYERYCKLIEKNDQAIQYYKKAKDFTSWLKSKPDLIALEYQNAYEIEENIDEYEEKKIWEGNSTQIFDIDNIENELSNFNQHRLAVIRHTIEKNLANAIANYNTFSGATNDFQMPELKENEWDNIINNISMISFLQGLNIGGKVYNGYTIVTNSESEEVVLEENIYILGDNRNYHKIGDKELEDGLVLINGGIYSNDPVRSSGRINLDFNKKYILNNSNLPLYYYPIQEYTASYKSIIMQDEVTPYEDIYVYIDKPDKPEDRDVLLATAFYTALGRERESKYDVTRVWDIKGMVPDVNDEPLIPEPIPTEYKVIYNLNGGIFAVAPGTEFEDIYKYKKGDLVEVWLIEDSDVSKSGYRLDGWKNSVTGNIYSYGETFEMPDSEVTLTAVWTLDI